MRLYVEISRGVEHHSFEFEKEWLKEHRNAFILDPDLLPVQGRQYPTGQKMTFGIFPMYRRTGGAESLWTEESALRQTEKAASHAS